MASVTQDAHTHRHSLIDFEKRCTCIVWRAKLSLSGSVCLSAPPHATATTKRGRERDQKACSLLPLGSCVGISNSFFLSAWLSACLRDRMMGFEMCSPRLCLCGVACCGLPLSVISDGMDSTEKTGWMDGWMACLSVYVKGGGCTFVSHIRERDSRAARSIPAGVHIRVRP